MVSRSLFPDGKTIQPPPSEAMMRTASRLLEPWRRLVDPVYLGLENIPEERPLLFVGNHSLYGVLDAPLMFLELYERRGIFLRSLGDRAHFRVPFWSQMLSTFGVVEGNPELCGRLMQQGEHILVFPGGAREVAKRKDEQYRLVWGDRAGFARLAIEHGCTIVPFAAVGAEDLFEILYDGDDVLSSPLGVLWKRFGLRQDFVPPLTRLRARKLSQVERFYFAFQEPIRTDHHGGQANEAAVHEVREATRCAIEAGILALKEHRQQDPSRFIQMQP